MRLGRILTSILLLALIDAPTVIAQPGGPAPVRFTMAIEGMVRGSVELTGTVTSRQSSVVAAEVAGLVVELSARRGDSVARRAPLVKIRGEVARLRLRAAEGELKEAEAQLRLAELARDRAKRLFDERVTSREQLDERLTEYDASQGRVDQLQADVSRLEDDYARTTVRAPFGGVITAERVAVGEWIAAGGPVAELVDLSNLELEIDVPERLYSGMIQGEPVRVGFAALNGLEVEGRVRAVIPTADIQARTFPVIIEIPNLDGRVGVGMLGRARLAVGPPRTSVLVPKDALVSQGSAILVFVLDDENLAQPVPVTTGAALEDWISVVGGVRQGDRVITLGNERLQPGQPVAPELQEYLRP